VLTARKQDDYQRLRSWNEAGYSLFAGTDAVQNTLVMTGHPVRRSSVEPDGQTLDRSEVLTREEAFTMFTSGGLKGRLQFRSPV
jgi:predicted amidohydrolase YtcJ